MEHYFERRSGVRVRVRARVGVIRVRVIRVRVIRVVITKYGSA